MKQRILNNLRKLRFESTAALYGPSLTKAVFMGHQKSGTTAIANLLAKRSLMSYSNDPVYFSCKESNEAVKLLENNSEEFVKIVEANKGLFYRNIVKDPDFSFFPNLIPEIYPSAQIVFISRNPFDIIRSIFNRLNIDGLNDASTISTSQMKNPTCQWDYIINGEQGCSLSVVTRLAQRIEKTTAQYIRYKRMMYLVKYEDFNVNKAFFIDKLAVRLGFELKKDITDSLDTQFQPKGQSSLTREDFFSEENIVKIIDNCPLTLSEFNYD